MLKIQDLASKLLIQIAKSMVPFQFEPCSVLTNLNQSAQITSWVIHMKKDHPLRHVQDGVKLAKKYKIHYFLIPMIHLVCVTLIKKSTSGKVFISTLKDLNAYLGK